MEDWRDQEVAEFALAVISKRSVTDVGTEYEEQGKGKEWQNCTTLNLAGFNDSRVLSLDHVWKQVLENRQTEFTGEVLALETIVKLDETLQLETPYEVEIRVSYQ